MNGSLEQQHSGRNSTMASVVDLVIIFTLLGNEFSRIPDVALLFA
jgi:hypothetical protein